jgi:hypothetical protein
MLLKSSLAALAAFAALAAAAPADARTRLDLQFFTPYTYSPSPEYYYPGPVIAPRPRYHAYVFEGDDEDEYGPAYAYEPDYYEPEYAPARKPRTHARSASRVIKDAPPVVKRKSAVTAKPAPAPAARLISCAKATGIVTGYGFSDVKPSDCKGQSYAFNARRDGKPYVIKLSARSGELTDVAKQ